MDDTDQDAAPIDYSWEPHEVTKFREWLAEFADTKDPVAAVIRLRGLTDLIKDVKLAQSVLQGAVTAHFGVGAHDIDGVGAFKVRVGAQKYEYPDDEDEKRDLLRDVLRAVPEGEDPLPLLERVWPLVARHARWTPVKEIGLTPGDYRIAHGRVKSVELL